MKKISDKLDVRKKKWFHMNNRLAGPDHSLNAQVGEDGIEWQDWLVDKVLDQEFEHQEEMEQRKDLEKNSIKLSVLNDRERKF